MANYAGISSRQQHSVEQPHCVEVDWDLILGSATKLTSLRPKMNILGLTKISEVNPWILLFLFKRKKTRENQHLPRANIRCAKLTLTFGT